ncbi:macro domain-containing protein [Actinokineospora cianjurensis]|uniref:O-acetyl-ADP-ribose deacetylase (Regulator of RNase III) n=1 Tax=Actinokineospora cianjurensis TaxID=585224 RepID=A0A421B6H7_9PSEU|nr:O-acetyl-ADP-ribose deacetylase (regulator of RNase III) [Actinokineospora cianjurensis]
MLGAVTADSETGMVAAPRRGPGPLELVLCAVGESLATAWETAAEGRPHIRVHRGSVLEVRADAVVSPANSYGWMRGGVDAVYAEHFPAIEQRVRSAVLAYHGGELPIGEALIVPTGAKRPAWLITAPTMKEPAQALAAETVHPYLAARAVFRLWRDGVFDNGAPVRATVGTIAMPGLGTGVGGVPPHVCARQLAAAWDAVFEPGSVART